ncbi:MAG: hypothetical protein ACOVK2_01230 [Candidatus Fonsibacter sp.]|jgi:hypothetical protein
MKRTILTVATILTLGLTSYSQTCDVKTTTDSYTGESKTETGFIKFNGGTYSLITKEYGILFWLQLESIISITVYEGDFIYFKLSDNSVVKFTVENDSYSRYSSSRQYTNSFGLLLEGEQLEALKGKEVIGIKCRVNEYNLSAKQGLQLKNNVECISKTK